MEDMAADYGWELDDFFEEEESEPTTPEQARQLAHEEAIGEMYASQFAFD